MFIEGSLHSSVALIPYFQIKQRVTQMLTMRGGSTKVIRGILRGKFNKCLHEFSATKIVIMDYNYITVKL